MAADKKKSGRKRSHSKTVNRAAARDRLKALGAALIGLDNSYTVQRAGYVESIKQISDLFAIKPAEINELIGLELFTEIPPDAPVKPVEEKKKPKQKKGGANKKTSKKK